MNAESVRLLYFGRSIGLNMAKSLNQKLKILHLMKFLTESTDEQHSVTMQEIIQMLEQNGITAERKSIYGDIEALRSFGMDIILRKYQPTGYYLASREFELPELKLLVDSVQASKFITTKKSRELITKLERLASKHDARQLQRQVVVTNRIKTMNESIYYNVDEIHMAISNNTKIQFQYTEWTVTKETKLRKNGKHYIISPWALSWEDENYYMIGFDSESGIVKHYRVDKMLNIEGREEMREGEEVFKNFDIAQYSKRTFSMYGGYDEKIVLRCNNSLIGVMIDRFGKDVILTKESDDTFIINVNVAVSAPFFGWLTTLGGGAVIVAPEHVREEYKSRLLKILKGIEDTQ